MGESRDTEIPIAVLLPTDVVGGHERMLLEWLSRAREFGLRTIVYCQDDSELSDLVRKHALTCKDGGYLMDRKDALRRAQWYNFVRTLRIATRLPRDTAVLLAPGGMQVGLGHVLACVLARRAIVCYVPMTHDAVTMRVRWPGVRDWLTARLISKIAMWITITDEQSRRLKSYWKVRAPVHVIPNRLRVLSTPPQCQPVETPGQSPLRVLYSGRFDEKQKGLDWLVEILGANHDWTATFSIVFQGRGPFLGRLEALSQRVGPDRIRILPWGSIAGTLATADVLLLTSRFEGFPLIAIEAIWAGVPVLATLESGLADVLPRECLYPFGNVAAFRAALERLRAPDKREAAVVHARSRLGVLLGEERYQRALLGIVEGLTNICAGRRIIPA